MYTLEGVSSVANFLLLMKSLNKAETPIFWSLVCFLTPKAIFMTFILMQHIFPGKWTWYNRYIVRHLYEVDNYHDCMFTFFCTKTLLKKGLFWKDGIYSRESWTSSILLE